MTSWWQLVPSMGVAVGFLLLPGFLVAMAWRLRPLMAVAVAGLLSFLSIDISVLLAQALSQRWNWIWPLAITAALALGGLWRWLGSRRTSVRALWKRRVRNAVPILGAYFLGLAAAVATIGRRIMWAMGGPEAIAQLWDNAFHLYASAYVLNTGEASPFDVGKLLSSGMYPASFHDAVAIVAQTGNISIPAATQAVTLLAVFVIWPLGLIPLVEVLLPMSVASRMFLGPVSLGLVVFPLALIDWGLVYPNILALCLTAPLLVVVLRIFGRGSSVMLSRSEAMTLVIPLTVALGMAHPNAVYLVFAAVIPILIAAVVQVFWHGRTVSAGKYTQLLGLISLGVLILGAMAWVKPPMKLGDDFGAIELAHDALWEIVRGASMANDPTPLGYFVLVGLAWIIWRFRRRWWWGAGACIVFALYIVSTSMTNRSLRHLLTGVLYGDQRRIGAYTAIFSVPLSIAGVQWIIHWVMRVISRVTPRLVGTQLRWLAWVLALVLAFLSCSLTVRTETFEKRMHEIEWVYSMDYGNQLISPDELNIMHQLKEITSKDDVIIVNPWQGGGLAYLYAERNVTDIYVFAPKTEDVELINKHLRDAAGDPEVCNAIERLGATYVLTLDPTTIGFYDVSVSYAGMSDLETAPGFIPVLRVGDDVAYKITACQ